MIRKKPGAKAPVAGKLPANAAVTVESNEKGWMRVRAKPPGKKSKEIIGYVESDKIDAGDKTGDAKTDTAATTPSAAPTDDTPTTDTPVPAETRQTSEKVVLRAKPGEKQAAVATLKAGASVTVEAERGRWLRVRAGKAVGYIARTTLVPVAPPPPPPPPPVDTTASTTTPTTPPPADSTPDAAPASKWSSGRETQLYAEVTGNGTLRSDPKPTAGSVAELPNGTKVVVIDATSVAGWVHARDDKGHEGWIASTELGNGATAKAIGQKPGARKTTSSTTASTTSVGEATAATATATTEDHPEPERKPSFVRLDVGLGYRVLGMDFTSNGSSGLANYLVSADASALDLDVDLIALHVKQISVAFDARTGLGRSSPGIEYMGPTLPSGKIPFSTVDVDAGARAGLRVRRLWELAVRGGVHYDAFVASNVENAGMLPRERLLGATVGARADISPPHTRFAATIHADVLAAGSRKQTPGLEDGTDSTAHAFWGGMRVRVLLTRHVSLLSGYDFGRMTTRWTGESVRMPGVTSARRVDSSQLVQIGLSVDM